MSILDCRNAVDAAELRNRLPDPERRPIVAVAAGGPRHRGCFDPRLLADGLGDAAEVCLLSEQGLPHLPEQLNVFAGAARIWYPGVDLDATQTHAREHPYFVAETRGEVEARSREIVEHVVTRISTAPRLVSADRRRRVSRTPTDVTALVATIRDDHREDAVIVATPGTLDTAACDHLAVQLQQQARLFVLDAAADVERLSAGLPQGLGLGEGQVRVWWPGVGSRTSTSVHPVFTAREAQSNGSLAAHLLGYVRRGAENPEYVRPDGSSEAVSPEDLAAHLLDSERTRIVVGLVPGPSGFTADPDELVRMLVDAADVVVLPTRAVSARLAALLPRGLAAWVGGVRLWLPGFSWTSRHLEHPVFKSNHPSGTDASLLAAVVEGVLRRVGAPDPGPRSDPGAHVRARIQHAAQLELDRRARGRRAAAFEKALDAALDEVRGPHKRAAVDGFRDAAEIVRWTVVSRYGEGSGPEILGLGRFAEGIFLLGQAGHTPSLRRACMEEALESFETALCFAEAMSVDEAEAFPDLDVYILRSKTVMMAQNLAKLRTRSRDRDRAAVVIERGLALSDQLLAEDRGSTARAWALTNKALLLKERRFIDAPRLTTEEEALTLLTTAAETATGKVGLVALGPRSASDTANAAEPPKELTMMLLGALADSYSETGDHELALEAFSILDLYRDDRTEGKQFEIVLRGALARGGIELDRGDFWSGVARLERELAAVKLNRLGTRARKEAISAIQRLAVVLHKQGAYRESVFYQDWAQRIGHPARLPATATIPVSRKRTRQRKGLQTPAEAGTGSPTAETPRPVNDARESRARALEQRISHAVRLEDVHHVVTNLIAASRDFARWAPAASHVPADDEATPTLNGLRDAIALADEWKPRRRAARDTRIPAEWFALPDASPENLNALSLAASLIALEFAENYRPGYVPTLAREVCGRIFDRHGPQDEVILAIAGAGASKAKALGRWHDAALAYILAARASLDSAPQRSIELVLEASAELRRGLSFLGLGDDRADALLLYEKVAGRIVELLVRAGASAKDIFAAVDQWKGQLLLTTRAATSDKTRDDEAIRELVDLQLRELDAHLAIRESSCEARSEVLEAIQKRVGAARRRVIREMPELLHLWEEPATQGTEQALRSQATSTAVVQYTVFEGSFYAAAVRCLDDGRIDYWFPSAPVADPAALRHVTDAVWEDVFAPPRSLSADASFEDAYDVFLGGADRSTGETLADFCSAASTLVFVPGSSSRESRLAPTARIPFHALMHGGRALVDDHDVYSAPSVAFWQRSVLDPALPSRRSLALGTAHDIDAPVECGTIARILRELPGFECVPIDDTGGVGRVLLPPDGRYKDELAVLHVAAHGKAIPYPDHMSSFIEFDDLCVTAREWLVHGPRAQFVFVNCCFLGRQASRAGDLYGMPFAILGSGTRSALLAMAPIEPELACGFAKLFYRNVVDGLGKAAACSGAMRSAIANGTPRRGWVPYFFLGDAAPLNAG